MTYPAFRLDLPSGMFAFLASVSLSVARAADPPAPAVLDVTRVLVLSNAELVSMGGAGVAFASGSVGMVLSPAAPANRRLETIAPIVSSLVLVQARISADRDSGNLSEPIDADGRMFNVGLSGGYRNAAGGLLAVGAYYKANDLWVGVTEGHACAAHALLNGRLTLGAGPRLLGMRVISDGGHHDYFGMGVETGALLANWQETWNLAVTLRSGVTARPLDGPTAGIDAASLPPELIAGVGWSNHASVPEASGGIPVRLVADVVIDAPVTDGVALGKVLQGQWVAGGDWYTVSPRVGAEVDVWRNRFRLRGGGYLEPSRTALAGPRPHATGGFELRLFRVKALNEHIKLDLAWQIGVDYAPRYFRGAFLGINVWQEGQVGGNYQPPKPRSPGVEIQ